MQIIERPQFDAALAAMFGAWNRICSGDAKEGYWKGCSLMALSDFVRATEKAVATLAEAPDTQLPHVGALWNIKRSLRVRAPQRPPEPEGDYDRWDMAANRHLFAYIQRKPKRYHPDVGPKGEPGPEGTRRTQCLVQAKNEWAQCMREEAQSGSVPIADQKSSWAVFMGQAEERIGA